MQAIHFRYYTDAADAARSFDYTICQFILTDEDIITTPEALWDLGRRRLAINEITYPTSTTRRLLKYTQQGYTACTGCLKTILMAPVANPRLLS